MLSPADETERRGVSEDSVAPAHVTIGHNDGPEDARLRALLGYWRGLAEPPALPARRLFRPQDVVPILPELALLDIDSEARHARFRLVGTHIVNGIGVDLTGKALGDLEPSPLREVLLGLVSETLRCAGPVAIGAHRLTFRSHIITLREALALPMADDGQRIDKLVLAMIMVPLSRIGPLSI